MGAEANPTTDDTEKPRYSESTRNVCNTIRLLADCAFKKIDPSSLVDLEGKAQIEKINLKDLVLAVHELTGSKQPLTDEILNSRLFYYLQDGKITQHFDEQKTYYAMVIPCSEKGFPLKPEYIEAGDYVRTMSEEDSKDLLKYFPDEIKALCGFQTGTHEKVPAGQPVTYEDRVRTLQNNQKRIAAEFKQAYRNAQLIFNEADPKDLN